MPVSKPSGGTSIQRNFWNGALSESVHSRVSAVVWLLTPTVKPIRFCRICSGLPSYFRQIANPARFLSVSLTALSSSDIAIKILLSPG
jgi:hypothetical protein